MFRDFSDTNKLDFYKIMIKTKSNWRFKLFKTNQTNNKCEGEHCNY